MAKYVNLELADVKIRQEFLDHPPKEAKVLARKAEYVGKGRFSRGMSVTSDGVLIDGYAAFMALKTLGKKSAQFKVRDETVVVDARHPSNPAKLYRWRVNHSKGVNFKPGDHVAVKTRYGVREAAIENVLVIPAEDALGLGIVIGLWDPGRGTNKNHE